LQIGAVMFKARVMPCLLLQDSQLVKTVRFKRAAYIGDPINTVRIFNEKQVDEIIILDIKASRIRAKPNFKMIDEIASECFMPLAYGGGITNCDDARTIFRLGVEKIIINSYAIENPHFIEEAAGLFGSQSIIVSLDVKKNILGDYRLFSHGGSIASSYDLIAFAAMIEKKGAGELFITSIDKDGTWSGYDLKLIRQVTSATSIPVIACGGAGTINDLHDAITIGRASAAAAGSMFVYQGKDLGVLINFPDKREMSEILVVDSNDGKENLMTSAVKICTRCVYDDTIPNISFDENGVCSYCKLHDNLIIEYPGGKEGENKLLSIIEEIKRVGRKNKKYDCVVGISGGCDSSFLLYKIKEYGLRPLAAHFDNTWNSTIATENMSKMLKKLKIDIFTLVVDNKEYDDIYRSFLLAGVPDTEIPTDIGLAATLNRAAAKFGIKYVIEGHSYRTEGISPLGWTYMDGKYIESIQKTYGSYKLNTFPNMKMADMMKWMLINRIKKIRPLWYIDHNKEETKKFLHDEFDWEWYGGHHLENRFTSFYHSYYLPQRWKIDKRKNGYSALIRSGQLKREDALAMLGKPHHIEPDLIPLVKKRLGFSDKEFEDIMTLPYKTYKDFKTYKKTFERLRPFFWLMYKLNYIPKSFYVKYTKKS
jgi:imidazoleglycerol phosphate synthase cyclase subunit